MTEQSQTIGSVTITNLLLQRFIEEFVAITGLRPPFDAIYLSELDRLATFDYE